MEKKIVGSVPEIALTACVESIDLEHGVTGYLDRVVPRLTGAFNFSRVFYFCTVQEAPKLLWPSGIKVPANVINLVADRQGEHRGNTNPGFHIYHDKGLNYIFAFTVCGCMVFLREDALSDEEQQWLREVMAVISKSITMITDVPVNPTGTLSLRKELMVLRKIVDQIPDPVYVKDLKGRKIMLNQAEVAILHAVSKEQVLGKTDDAFYLPDVAAKTRQEDQELFATGNAIIYGEHTLATQSGEKIWLEGKKIPLYDAQGNIEGLIGISKNITARKKAEQEVRDNYEKYQSIFNSFLDLYFRSDLMGRIIDISPSVYKLSGYLPEEIIGKPADIFYADAGSREKMIGDLLLKGSINDYENTLVRKDGSRVPVSITGRLRYTSDGRPDFFEGSIRDISERKASQEKLSRMLRLQNVMTRMATGFINIPIDQSDVAVDNLLALVGEENDIDRVYIFSYDFKAGVMNNTHEWCSGGITPEIENLKDIPLELFPAWIQTHLKGEMLIVHDVNQLAGDDMLRQVLEPQGIKTLITVPMIINRECLGFVGLDSVRTTKQWAPEEIAFLQLLADLLCNVTDRRRTEQTLKTREAYLKAVFDNVPYHMWLKDRQGRYLLVNQPFLDFFDITSHDYPIGRTDMELWPDEMSKQFMDEDQEVMETGQLRVIEKKLEIFGKRVWFEIYRAPVVDPGGRLLGTIGIANDITNRILADHELKKATTAAQSASEAKTRFLANMSHEIRTPLNAIIGMVRLLLESRVDPSQLKLLNNMKASSENLLSIINDILDFSKIESGQIEISKTDFNLPELIRKIYDSNEFRAEDKGIKFHYSMDSRLGKNYKGDSVRIQQVLNNLVSNALKFTAEGTVELTLDLVEQDIAGDRVRFAVQDSGIGISTENQKKIFESFQQEDESITRTYGGTGLGLAISRQLVELMGGNLELESEKNKGSRFFFTIPLDYGEEVAQPVPAAQSKGESESLRGARILLVEDNKFNQFIAQAILDKWNAVTRIAEDGQQAVDLLRNESFDLVLMDIQMPVMDGITAATIIRKEMGIATPILALTANVVKGIAERCEEAGMQGYISKPFDEDDLFRKIISVIEVSRPTPENSVVPSEVVPLADVSRLAQMVSNDPRMLGMMINKFIEVTPEYVQELRTATTNRDVDGISRTSHKLKSAIDLVSGDIIRDLIREINNISRKGHQPAELYAMIGDFLRYYDELTEQLKSEIPMLS